MWGGEREGRGRGQEGVVHVRWILLGVARGKGRARGTAPNQRRALQFLRAPLVSSSPTRSLSPRELKQVFLIKIRKKKKIIEKHAQPDGKNNKNKRQTPLQDGRWVRISLHASSCIPILAVAGCPYTQSPRSRAGWRFPTAQKDAEKPPKERKPESTMRPIAAVPLTA